MRLRRRNGGQRVERSSGGLASALDSAWREHSGIWIGWPGTAHDGDVEQALRRWPAASRQNYRTNSEIRNLNSGLEAAPGAPSHCPIMTLVAACRRGQRRLYHINVATCLTDKVIPHLSPPAAIATEPAVSANSVARQKKRRIWLPT